jgi:hypothetical protein
VLDSSYTSGKTALGFKVYTEKTGNSKCASTMKML